LSTKFSFDPVTLQATVLGNESENPEALDEQWTQYKSEVQEALEAYVKRNFRDGTTRATLFFNEDSQLQIEISCINVNLPNFWGGEWQSKWIVNTTDQTLSGNLRLNNHYFESGNIQFNLEKDFDAVKLPGANGLAIMK